MPTLNINITAISGTTGTYDKASGPGQVASNGDVDFKGSQANASVDLSWTLADSLGKTFAATGFSSAPVPGQSSHANEFGSVSLSNNNKTLSVQDNNDAGDQYEYSLTLSDGTVLDPKIINR